MPIQVTCPGCLKRFSVSEKFAGKEGPCPQCKTVITIPKPGEEVVIHEAQHEAGAVGTGGRHALKTYRRKDTKFKPVVFAAVAVGVLLTFVAALLLRSMAADSWWPAILGAVALGPPLAGAGYTFLRDAELEPYAGPSLLIRSAACGFVYALMWGVFAYLGEQVFGDKDFSTPLALETFQLLIVSAIVLGIGTFAAYVSFDLEPFAAFFNCALFFAATVLLRLVAGLPALPGLVTG